MALINLGKYKIQVIYADNDSGNISNEEGVGAPSNFTAGYIEVTETQLGDLNQDGKINAQDVTILMRGLAHLVELTDAQKAAADVNGDGKVNAQDATILSRYLAHLITEFPLCT